MQQHWMGGKAQLLTVNHHFASEHDIARIGQAGWVGFQKILQAPEVLLPSTERININIVKVTGGPAGV